MLLINYLLFIIILTFSHPATISTNVYSNSIPDSVQDCTTNSTSTLDSVSKQNYRSTTSDSVPDYTTTRHKTESVDYRYKWEKESFTY